MVEDVVIEPAEYLSKYKIKLSKEFLIKIKSLFVDYHTQDHFIKINLLLEKEQPNYEIEAYILDEIITKLKDKINNFVEPNTKYVVDSNKNVIINFEKEQKQLEKLMLKYNNISKISINSLLRDLKVNEFVEFINVAEKIVNLNKKMYKKRDLIIEKHKIVESLQNIISLEHLNEIEKKYNNLIEQDNVELLEKFLILLQEIIKNDFQKKITNVEDYIPGSPFNFLCHATINTNWNGDFYDRYVSTSLLTNEIFGTYKSNFGFIISPENIVGADSDDMFVKNHAESQIELTSSSIPKIHSIDKIVNDCKKRHNDKEGRAYNEVVIDGFNPVSIFCKTLGEKNLNFNYQQALELQKSFPNLKIIEIDGSLYKKDEEIKASKQGLIFKLLKKIDPYYEKYDYDFEKHINVDDYSLFWNGFMNLKSQQNYSEEQILNLFKRNNKIISTSMFPEQIFSGIYTEEEIKFSLLYGYNYRINDLLNGNFNSYNFSSMVRLLLEYKENPILLKLFPNINFVIDLFSKVEISNEMIDEINSIKGLDFIKLYSYLNICYRNQLDTKKSEVDSEFKILMDKKENLYNQLQSQQNLLAQQKLYNKIINFEFYYKLAMKDYEENLEENKNIEKKLKILTEELNSMDLIRTSLLEKKQKYNKHKFINRNKLKKLHQKLNQIEEKISTLLFNKSELEDKKLMINPIEILREFKKQTDIELFEYEKELDFANKNYNISEEIRLGYNINKILHDLDQLQNEIDKFTLKSNALDCELNSIQILPTEEKNIK